MRGVQVVLALLVLALLGLTEQSSSSGSSNSKTLTAEYPSSELLSGSALTNLYNSPVYQAERMKRPLGILNFSHSGVRVTLGDGSQYLIHKGSGYGISSQTVVTPAENMSDQWRTIQTTNFHGRKTVGNLVAAGGTNYRLVTDNCHDASKRIMDLSRD
ncbi:unnamed protein product [Ophioblennius macclurei]